MGIPENVTDLLDPVVASLDVELVDVEYTGGTLRLTVDQADGISTDMLARVNRLVSPVLDQHDPIPGRYTLEVSSPGIERRLRSVDHYRRALGEEIVVKLAPPAEPRRLRGRLVEASDDAFVIDAVEIDGLDLSEQERRSIAYADVAKSRTIFEWGPSPKPGGPKKSGKKPKPANQGAANQAAATKKAQPKRGSR